MTLRLSAEEDRALTLLAAAQGRSKHDAAVRAIVAAAARSLLDSEVHHLAYELLADYRETQQAITQAKAKHRP
ncbi:hypothetical protein CCHOA_00040 [Corynebacterium choanae]|uniref:CopG family transcriptional regulator n=2 Tax=Corynebacterium choanae TaxID=1862358 RepID=A0A3G6J413_9CORY|nr:hypothetical protein CCHOA_00040 [Corynebacterium choanae]